MIILCYIIYIYIGETGRNFSPISIVDQNGYLFFQTFFFLVHDAVQWATISLANNPTKTMIKENPKSIFEVKFISTLFKHTMEK